MMQPSLRNTIPMLLLLTASCSEGDGARDIPTGTLRLVPAQLVLETAPNVTVQRPYQVQRWDGRGWADVTAEASLTVEPQGDAWFEGTTLVASGRRGLRAQVRAVMLEGAVLEGPLTVRLVKHVEDASSTPEAAQALDLPANEAPVALTYPADGVLMPPNVWGLPLQWQSDFTATYRVELTSDVVRFTIDRVCGAGSCTVALDGDMLGALSATYSGRGGELHWSVRGASADGARVARSATHKLELATEPLRGTLYYWVAEPGTIVRKDYDSPDPVETYLAGSAASCVGCHAVSRDGRKLAAFIGMPAPAQLAVYDVAERQQVMSSAANFAAFSPDASALVRTSGSGLVIERDNGDGTTTTTELAEQGTQPDWSPDGGTIVFSAAETFDFEIPGWPGEIPGMEFEQISFSSGVLNVVRDEGAGFGAPVPLLATPGANDYYPTFSPDGGWILFNRSASNANSYEAMDARVWLASADGSTVVDLARANSTGHLTNSWPKFAPFVQQHAGRRIAWITFSSRRPNPGGALAANAQVWMAAVDLDAAADGEDPSYPAFWLPFQSPAAGNHLAQWAERLVRKEE